jgi:hypothetical protein
MAFLVGNNKNEIFATLHTDQTNYIMARVFGMADGGTLQLTTAVSLATLPPQSLFSTRQNKRDMCSFNYLTDSVTCKQGDMSLLVSFIFKTTIIFSFAVYGHRRMWLSVLSRGAWCMSTIAYAISIVYSIFMTSFRMSQWRYIIWQRVCMSKILHRYRLRSSNLLARRIDRRAKVFLHNRMGWRSL